MLEPATVPSVSLNEGGELILSIEGESTRTFNIGKVKGEKGDKGTDGYTPQKGIDYFDGKDGKDGQNGKDGYVPIRGIDYWTEDDIAEIKSYVDEAILGGAW